MSKDAFVFEVSQQSFEKSVLLESAKIPVIVEFMGVWSESCILMADLFSDLAREFAGDFIFAKVDIDEQAELREQYKIENVPTVLVFKNGEPVLSEVGQMQEAEARSLLKGFGIYHKSDLLREQAREKHLAGATSEAIMLLTEAIQQDPANTRVAMDMVQIFLDIGELGQAQSLYAKLPDKDTAMGKALSGQLVFADLAAKTAGSDELSQKLSVDQDDHDARFDLAVCLVSAHQYTEAMDNLFYILEKEAEYREGAARDMIVTITHMIAPVNAEQAQAFRRRLANALSA